MSARAQERYGEIKHPTIDDIVLMIMDFLREHPDLTIKDVDVWKTDLRGAYTLMSFKDHNCKLFAVELSNEVVIIFLCGLFGWSSTPAAFQVITRAITFELTHPVRSGANVCRRHHWSHC